jgi:hypothetical protein
VQGFETFAVIMGATGGLAVDGDELVAIRPERGDPGVEAASKQDWIDPFRIRFGFSWSGRYGERRNKPRPRGLIWLVFLVSVGPLIGNLLSWSFLNRHLPWCSFNVKLICRRMPTLLLR